METAQVVVLIVVTTTILATVVNLKNIEIMVVAGQVELLVKNVVQLVVWTRRVVVLHVHPVEKKLVWNSVVCIVALICSPIILVVMMVLPVVT